MCPVRGSVRSERRRGVAEDLDLSGVKITFVGPETEAVTCPLRVGSALGKAAVFGTISFNKSPEAYHDLMGLMGDASDFRFDRTLTSVTMLAATVPSTAAARGVRRDGWSVSLAWSEFIADSAPQKF